jgi:phospholipase/carboxylesterase
MIDLGETLGLPDVAIVAPEAQGGSWWPVSFLAPMSELRPWLDRGIDAVDEAVAALEAEGLARSAIAVCGFSQGGCLALEHAARKEMGLSAVFGSSSALLGTDDGPGEARADLHGYCPKRKRRPAADPRRRQGLRQRRLRP